MIIISLLNINGKKIEGQTRKVNCLRSGPASGRERGQIQMTSRGHALVWSFCLSKYFLNVAILKYSRCPLENRRILGMAICFKKKKPAKNTYMQQFLSGIHSPQKCM